MRPRKGARNGRPCSLADGEWEVEKWERILERGAFEAKSLQRAIALVSSSDRVGIAFGRLSKEKVKYRKYRM